MNKKIFIILYIPILLFACIVMYMKHEENKLKILTSPVEEIYHRQLVTTLDSLLDARFGPGCCDDDDVIDEDSLRLSLIQRFNLSDFRP